MNEQEFNQAAQKYAKRHKCDIRLAKSQIARWADPIVKSKPKKSGWQDTVKSWKSDQKQQK